METASASSLSGIGLSGSSSQFPRIEEGGCPGGHELGDELMFDLDVDLVADDTARQGLGDPRRKSLRPRFPPCQVEFKAYVGEIDDSIEDTLCNMI